MLRNKRQAGGEYPSFFGSKALKVALSSGCCTCHRGAPGPPGRPGADGVDGIDGVNGDIGDPGREAQEPMEYVHLDRRAHQTSNLNRPFQLPQVEDRAVPL